MEGDAALEVDICMFGCCSGMWFYKYISLEPLLSVATFSSWTHKLPYNISTAQNLKYLKALWQLASNISTLSSEHYWNQETIILYVFCCCYTNMLSFKSKTIVLFCTSLLHVKYILATVDIQKCIILILLFLKHHSHLWKRRSCCLW